MMPKQERKSLIAEIEEKRGSKLLCYVSGDRRNLETKIGMDVFPIFYELLGQARGVQQLDLFLYSTGGVTMAAWGLVTLIRRFCRRFSVLIPFRAYSTATLIALGADEIIMGPLGQLTPIDPSVTSPFNPPALDPHAQHGQRFLPVSVEDVIGYLNLARGEAGLKGRDAMKSVFERLSGELHPLALGGVYRAREQIRMLASRLLRLHMSERENRTVEYIVKKLTEELFSHDYLIGPKEAREQLKLKVVEDISGDLETLMWRLFGEYQDLLELDRAYDPDIFLGYQDAVTRRFNRAMIETSARAFVFRTIRDFRRVSPPPDAPSGTPPSLLQRTTEMDWREDNEI